MGWANATLAILLLFFFFFFLEGEGLMERLWPFHYYQIITWTFLLLTLQTILLTCSVNTTKYFAECTLRNFLLTFNQSQYCRVLIGNFVKMSHQVKY